MAHMETGYSAARKTWYQSPVTQKEGKVLKKSLETKESRDEFVRKAFEVEWAEMREEEEAKRRFDQQIERMMAQQRHMIELLEQHRAAPLLEALHRRAPWSLTENFAGGHYH